MTWIDLTPFALVGYNVNIRLKQLEKDRLNIRIKELEDKKRIKEII